MSKQNNNTNDKNSEKYNGLKIFFGLRPNRFNRFVEENAKNIVYLVLAVAVIGFIASLSYFESLEYSAYSLVYFFYFLVLWFPDETPEGWFIGITASFLVSNQLESTFLPKANLFQKYIFFLTTYSFELFCSNNIAQAIKKGWKK